MSLKCILDTRSYPDREEEGDGMTGLCETNRNDDEEEEDEWKEDEDEEEEE